MSNGLVEITTGAKDMANFSKTCKGTRIITHLNPFENHGQYVELTK
jgi:hypothetical protein